MQTIEATSQFKRDFKRETKGANRDALQKNFPDVLKTLAKDQPLAEKYCDHGLIGEWKDHRDCHVKPDLVLIYRKLASDVLQLVRLGSHSALGL